MKIFKKITGYLLIVIAILLSIAILSTLPNCIQQCTAEIQKSGSTGIPYALGSLVMEGIFIVIIIFCGKKGLKLIRKKIKSKDPIDEIGL